MTSSDLRIGTFVLRSNALPSDVVPFSEAGPEVNVPTVAGVADAIVAVCVITVSVTVSVGVAAVVEAHV